MASSENWSPERVSDRLQIQDVLSRYGRAVDRIDLTALAAIFHPDAGIDNGSKRLSVEEFVAGVGRRHPGVLVGFHLIVNVIIDFVAPDRAFVESYSLALEQHPPIKGEGPLIDRLGRVRSGDVFERRDGEWRIASRIIVLDHVSLVPVDTEAVDPIPSVPGARRYLGVRGAQDPVTLARASLGKPV